MLKRSITLGEFRKLTSSLSEETEIEIMDENTGEVYEIHEITTSVRVNHSVDNSDRISVFGVRLTTNIGLQSDSYTLIEGA